MEVHAIVEWTDSGGARIAGRGAPQGRCSVVYAFNPDVFDANGATILKLSLGAALRKDVVLLGAVSESGNSAPPTVAEAGPWHL